MNTTEATPETPARGTVNRSARLEALTGLAFILPALIGFVLFYMYPALRGLWISFTDWNMLREPTFVGIENYRQVFQDEKFWNALWITFKYVLLNIPIQTILGILLAVAMDRVVKSTVIRGLMILPYLLSNVLVALVFLWLLDPSLGIVNAGLQALGLPKQDFFASTDQALPTVAFVNIWRHAGFTALLFYAGLQSIPRSVYEAAKIDGASEGQMFWRITLPLLRPVTVFVVVTSIIGSFQIFDTVAVATNGGPADATKVLVYYIYENAFAFFKMGYATAMSMILFAIILIFTVLQLKFFRADQSDLA
ncbi:carbohydrate ABC transporter permease [Deinococcus cellulosilyticus]|uniref:Sugar ABC transporter permease n=1 Tax=Deinococcus cellulosilyticus (strain DSM 18568 / NBRC 106333 / KACC 11606 / 5516J-15) TaxID=1223518 RepID=A0A511MZX0_DEIC1|nr:sugar ABC transporter permease [Deinococcus cellulosilyticus]GEM46170.1 sugar ABC transporter permease [Deinococcus cellulosilyticus NBRC 106333 = KACC 11606]